MVTNPAVHGSQFRSFQRPSAAIFREVMMAMTLDRSVDCSCCNIMLIGCRYRDRGTV